MGKQRYTIVDASGLNERELQQARQQVEKLNATAATAEAQEVDMTALKQAFIEEHYTVAQRAMSGYDGLARKTLVRNARRDGLYEESITDEAVLADLKTFYLTYEEILNPLMKVRAAAELVLAKRIEMQQQNTLPRELNWRMKDLVMSTFGAFSHQEMVDFYTEIGALALAAIEQLQTKEDEQ